MYVSEGQREGRGLDPRGGRERRETWRDLPGGKHLGRRGQPPSLRERPELRPWSLQRPGSHRSWATVPAESASPGATAEPRTGVLSEAGARGSPTAPACAGAGEQGPRGLTAVLLSCPVPWSTPASCMVSRSLLGTGASPPPPRECAPPPHVSAGVAWGACILLPDPGHSWCPVPKAEGPAELGGRMQPTRAQPRGPPACAAAAGSGRVAQCWGSRLTEPLCPQTSPSAPRRTPGWPPSEDSVGGPCPPAGGGKAGARQCASPCVKKHQGSSSFCRAGCCLPGRRRISGAMRPQRWRLYFGADFWTRHSR